MTGQGRRQKMVIVQSRSIERIIKPAKLLSESNEKCPECSSILIITKKGLFCKKCHTTFEEFNGNFQKEKELE